MDEIKQVTGWKIGNKIFLSQKSALRSLAWRKLDRKYNPKSELEDNCLDGTLYDVRSAGICLECDCIDDTLFEPPYNSLEVNREFCPIHAHKTGYFYRVVERFKRRWATE